MVFVNSWAKALIIRLSHIPTLKHWVIVKHFGFFSASLKDLGKKISAFSKFDKDGLELLGKLK